MVARAVGDIQIQVRGISRTQQHCSHRGILAGDDGGLKDKAWEIKELQAEERVAVAADGAQARDLINCILIKHTAGSTWPLLCHCMQDKWKSVIRLTNLHVAHLCPKPRLGGITRLLSFQPS